MTTANLSVGIDTAPAKASLAELKTALQGLSSTNVEIDFKAAVDQLKTKLEKESFNIRVNVSADSIASMKTRVGQALREVITGPNREIRVNHESLKRRVETAIRGANVTLGATQIGIDGDSVVSKFMQSNLAKQLQSMPIGVDGTYLNEVVAKTRGAMSEGFAGSGAIIKEQIEAALSKIKPKAVAQVGVMKDFLREDLELKVAKIKGLKVEIGANKAELRGSILLALDEKFNVNIDEAALTTRVAAAIQAGFKIANAVDVRVSAPPAPAAPPAAPLNPAILAAALTQSLAPVLDRVAESVADAVKSIQQRAPRTPKVDGPPDPNAGSNVKASKAFSALDPSTGARLSTRESIDATEAAAKIEELNKQRDLEKASLIRQKAVLASRDALMDQRLAEIGKTETDRERADLVQKKNELRVKQSLLDQRLREVGAAESASEREALLQKAREYQTKNSLLNQRLSEIGKIEQGEERERLLKERRELATKQSLTNQRLKEIGQQESAQAKEEASRKEGQFATRSALMNQRLKEIGQTEQLQIQEALTKERNVLATKASLLNQRLAEIGKTEQTAEKEAIAKELASNATKTALLNQKLKEIGKSESAQEKEEILKEQRQIATRTALMNQRLAEIGKSEQTAEKEAIAKELASNASRTALLNQKIKEIGKSEVAVEKEKLLQEQRVLLTRQSLTAQRLREVGALEAEAKAAATKYALDNVKFFRPGMKDELKRLEAQLSDVKKAQSLVEQNQMAAAIKQYGAAAVDTIPKLAQLEARIKALAVLKAVKGPKSGDADIRAEMGTVYNNAKFAAEERYNPQGQKRAGAQALVNKYGVEATGKFLKNTAILDDLGNMERFAKSTQNLSSATRGSTEAMRSWNTAAREGHSLTRGLAGSLGAMWLTWGSTVPLVAGAALGMMIRDVYKSGKDLEYQLGFVAVLTNSTAISMKELGTAISGSMVAPVEAGKALRGLAQNGLSAQQALMALPDILALATAGEMDLNEAALGATGVMAAFNLQVTEIGRVGDVFAKAAAESNTSVSAMVEAMRQASTVGDKYKVSLEETGASLAVLAKRNISGSAAGTAFRNMMVELATPTEKARKAMKQLGMELYDTNNQLLPFPEVMAKLRDATLSLNEKGRLTFLEELFDERGAKAANALLTDFKELGRLTEKLNNSDGFARGVVEALGETTQGKIQKLMSEFQMATSNAFMESSESVKAFVDSLRAMVTSTDFKQFLKDLTEGVISLTQWIANSGRDIASVVVTWLGLRAVIAVVTTLATATWTLAGAATGLGVALGGPIALIALLAINYVSWTQKSDAAAEAMKAQGDAVRNSNKALESSIEQTNLKSQALKREIDLLYQGVAANKANEMSERDLARSKISSQKASTQSQLVILEAEMLRMQSDFKAAEQQYGSVGARDRLDSFKSQAAEARSTLQALELQSSNLELGFKQADDLKFDQRVKNALAALSEYNEKARQINEQGKLKTKLPIVDLKAFKGVSPEGVASAAEALQANLNRSTGGFERSNPRTEAAANRLQRQETGGVVDDLKRQEEALKRTLSWQKQLDETRFSSDRFGPYVAEVLAEQRALEANNKTVEMQIRAIATLTEEKAKAKDPAEVQAINREMASRVDALSVLGQTINQERELAKVKAEARAEKQSFDFTTGLSKTNLEVDQYLDKLRLSKSLKVTDPITGAGDKAAFEVESRYKDQILGLESQINREREASALLQYEVEQATAGQVDYLMASLLATNRQLTLDERRLATLKETAKLNASKARGIAVGEEERSRTSEFGMERFWAEYTTAGESAADRTYKAMKSATDKMSDAMSNFVATGKIDFKGLIQSMMADLLKLQMQDGFRQLLQMGIKGLGSLGFGPAALPSATGAFGVGPTGFAMGGIMTSSGPIPLRRYGVGGIARGRQFAEFGEGSSPEAYVPLPDGRTIPVSMKAPAAGRSVNVSYAPVIHIDSRTDRAQVQSLVSDAVGQGQEQMIKILKEQGILG